jgi:CRISPR-associated protein Cas1
VAPPKQLQPFTRIEQYKAFENGKRMGIARKFIEAKVSNSLNVLEYLESLHPEIIEDNKASMAEINAMASKVTKTKRIRDLLGFEGKIAERYFGIISSQFDIKLDFPGRKFGSMNRPMGAVDPINCLLNYGYSLVESQCWRAINSNGLDPAIGFVHQVQRGKYALVYDLQEPFRWMADMAVIRAMDAKTFTKKDFIITENYNVRLRPHGAKKLIRAVNEQFTEKVTYKGQKWEWGYVINQKTHELAQYIAGKRKTLDLGDPPANPVGYDTHDYRQKILDMEYKDWVAMGMNRSTLHYLKKRIKEGKPLNLNRHIKDHLLLGGSK